MENIQAWSADGLEETDFDHRCRNHHELKVESGSIETQSTDELKEKTPIGDSGGKSVNWGKIETCSAETATMRWRKSSRLNEENHFSKRRNTGGWQELHSKPSVVIISDYFSHLKFTQ